MSALTREELRVRVVVEPTGDWAECADRKAARIATARRLMRDARENGAGEPTASFIVDGQHVRSGVRSADL